MIPIFPFTQPPLPGYGHYIPSNESIMSAEAHDMSKYISSVRFTTWEELARRKPQYNVESVIEQWLESQNPVNPADPKVWQWIDSALNYVLKKIIGTALLTLQAGIVGVVTLADKIAWILRQGIDLSKQVGMLVFNLMRKIMQALSLVALKTDVEITQLFIRDILLKLIERMNLEARRAVQKFN